MPADSSTELATAVEVPTAAVIDRASQLLLGIAIGVIGTAALGHILLQWELRNIGATYRGFGFEPGMLPRLTTSLPWVAGVPLAAAVAIGMLVWRRPRSFGIPLALAIAFVGALLATWYLPTLPFRDIAGRIE